MTGGEQKPEGFSLKQYQPLPQTFAESVARIQAAVQQIFAQEIAQKQLFYHNFVHTQDVQRRSHLILKAIAPILLDSQPLPYFIDLTRTKLLLDLCAVAHDMVQIFSPQSHHDRPRRRTPGVSEDATTEQLLEQISALNQQLKQTSPQNPAQFTPSDIDVIRMAIRATVCVYDPIEQTIYQPHLYGQERSLPLVARILALADLGALGIDGIAVYNREGSLLFLEENPDIVLLLKENSINDLEASHPQYLADVQQRLLKRCRFQVSFARSRIHRLESELQGFPNAAIPVLTKEVFQHLNFKTLGSLEAQTPTDDKTTLAQLLQFFQFERYLKPQQSATEPILKK